MASERSINAFDRQTVTQHAVVSIQCHVSDVLTNTVDLAVTEGVVSGYRDSETNPFREPTFPCGVYCGVALEEGIFHFPRESLRFVTISLYK